MATWTPYVQRGEDTVIGEIENATFESTGSEYNKKIKDLKFNPDLTAISWTSQSDNSASWTSQTKN